jgi:hypothetical protein
MKESDFEERFDRLEKRIQEGFTQVTGLIDSIANLCAREFTAINEHFAKVDGMLANAKYIYALDMWTVEKRPNGWYFSKSALPRR